MEWRKLDLDLEPADDKERLYAQWLKFANPPQWGYAVFEDAAYADLRGYTHVRDIEAPDDKGGK